MDFLIESQPRQASRIMNHRGMQQREVGFDAIIIARKGRSMIALSEIFWILLLTG